MFYVVEDRDGDISYHTTDKDSPDIQHHLDKYAYFDAEVKQYPELWEVWCDEALWSIHSNVEDAANKVNSNKNLSIRKVI